MKRRYILPEIFLDDNFDCKYNDNGPEHKLYVPAGFDTSEYDVYN